MDYRKLYLVMVDAAERAIEAIDGGDPLAAKKLLIAGEQRAEELYIESEDKSES